MTRARVVPGQFLVQHRQCENRGQGGESTEGGAHSLDAHV